MTELAKAELRQLDTDFDQEIEPGNWTKVQFNPDSLKVSFANQVATPSGSGDQNGSPSRLFVGAGTTKLSVMLWFDVTGEQGESEAVDDVRKLTQKVAFYITPQKDKKDPKKFVPPATRFLWGSFQFDGIVEAMEETLEFFSSEGRPLRASIGLTLTQQKISKFVFRDTSPPGGSADGDPTGTRPLTSAPAGATVQGLAAQQGRGDDWQGIAAANNVENPRQLPPGQLLDMQRSQVPG